MLKTKAKFKGLVALAVSLFAVCVLNMNTVNATTQEEVQAMLNVIPDKIILDITEAEYDKADNMIKQKIETILKNNGFSTEGLDLYVYGTKLFYLDIHTATISINSKTKNISVEYSNSNQRTSADEQIVKNIKIESPKYSIIDIDKCDNLEEIFKIAKEYYTNSINNKDIKIEIVCGAGGGELIGTQFGEHGADIGLIKNGIVYDIRTIGCLPFVSQIIIPDNIKDTDEDYINYAMPIIKQYLKENRSDMLNENEINKITITKGGSVEYFNRDSNRKSETFNVENGYTVKCISEFGEETATIILKKAKSTSASTAVKKEDTTTKIKLEADTTVIPANTVLNTKEVKEEKTLKVVKESLKEVSNKYVTYDITLTNNNVKIQPNGKVKISIPVPSDFDKTKLAVYRIADNGDKTEYTVMVNGDVATFETDHFSTYVLAEKETKSNTNNVVDKEQKNNNTKETRKKDDTPKTGTTASIYFMIPIAVISAIGIIAFRRKETK